MAMIVYWVFLFGFANTTVTDNADHSLAWDKEPLSNRSQTPDDGS